MPAPQNILLLQTAYTGDVVLALPVAQVLKKHYPDATIHFVLRKGNENLLRHHPSIDRIWLRDKKQKKNRSLFRLVTKLKRFEWDLVINMHRFFSSGLLIAAIKSKKKIGFDKNPLSYFYDVKIPHKIPYNVNGRHLHEVERNLKLLEPLGIEEFERPRLYPSRSDRKKVADYVKSPYYVIAPASVWSTKQWPLEKWVTLVQQINQEAQLNFIGSGRDHKFCSRIAQHHPNAMNLCGQLTFLQSSALMEKAKAVITNDSAPLHFASAMNAPTVALFCSTIPAFGFGPLADQQAIIEREEPLKCRPCGLHGYHSCPEKHFKCARELSEKQVLKVIRGKFD